MIAAPSLPVVGRPSPKPGGDPRLRADARELHRALAELIRVYQFRDRDRICCHGLSVSQCYALDAIVRSDGLSVNHLAAELVVDKSTVSRVVKGLQEKGMVIKGKHPDDGRVAVLRPSQHGCRVHAMLEEEILAQEEEILSHVDPLVRAHLTQALHALARAALERVDTSGGCCRVR